MAYFATVSSKESEKLYLNGFTIVVKKRMWSFSHEAVLELVFDKFSTKKLDKPFR